MSAQGLAGEAHERTEQKGAEDDAACQAWRAGAQSESAGQPHESSDRVRSRETRTAHDVSRHACQQAHVGREPAKFRNVPGAMPIGRQLQRGHGSRYQNQAEQCERGIAWRQPRQASAQAGKAGRSGKDSPGKHGKLDAIVENRSKQPVLAQRKISQGGIVERSRQPEIEIAVLESQQQNGGAEREKQRMAKIPAAVHWLAAPAVGAVPFHEDCRALKVGNRLLGQSCVGRHRLCFLAIGTDPEGLDLALRQQHRYHVALEIA